MCPREFANPVAFPRTQMHDLQMVLLAFFHIDAGFASSHVHAASGHQYVLVPISMIAPVCMLIANNGSIVLVIVADPIQTDFLGQHRGVIVTFPQSEVSSDSDVVQGLLIGRNHRREERHCEVPVIRKKQRKGLPGSPAIQGEQNTASQRRGFVVGVAETCRNWESNPIFRLNVSASYPVDDCVYPTFICRW